MLFGLYYKCASKTKAHIDSFEEEVSENLIYSINVLLSKHLGAIDEPDCADKFIEGHS